MYVYIGWTRSIVYILNSVKLWNIYETLITCIKYVGIDAYKAKYSAYYMAEDICKQKFVVRTVRK